MFMASHNFFFLWILYVWNLNNYHKSYQLFNDLLTLFTLLALVCWTEWWSWKSFQKSSWKNSERKWNRKTQGWKWIITNEQNFKIGDFQNARNKATHFTDKVKIILNFWKNAPLRSFFKIFSYFLTFG